MSDQSFAGLCERMKGLSITMGWDAVVAMSRTKVNSLLEQQYVARFKDFEDKDRLLEKMYGSVKISADGYSMLDLSALILSPPRLSFETASLANAWARLTMDVESGTVTRRVNVPGYPSRVTDSFTATPQHGFKVWMDIELVASTGTVDDERKVIINLGNAVNFSTNLVEDSVAQIAIASFLEKRYKQLPPELQIYEVGILDFHDDDLLVPREFEIRTQKAPSDNAVLSEGGEGGAVVLFIRTRNNPSNGTTPSKDTDIPYLIPDNRNPVTGELLYSGALVLASRVLFDWYVEPYFMKQIGSGLRFEREIPSNFVARSLRAMAGGVSVENFSRRWATSSKSSDAISNNGPMFIGLKGTERDAALLVYVDEDLKLCMRWRGQNKIPFFYERGYVWPIRPDHYYYDAMVTSNVFLPMNVVLDKGSILTFQVLPDAVIDISGIWGVPEHPLPQSIQDELDNHLSPVLEALAKVFKNIEIPEIDVFYLKHLLFPKEQALQLTDVALPGDLFMVGRIDPKKTTFTLEPLFGRVKAGNTLQLNIKHLTLRDNAITWTVHNMEGEALPDAINQDGLFTAPDLAHLQALVEHYIITAAYISEIGTAIEASALIAVVPNSLSVTPSIATLDVIDPDSKPDPVKLRAVSLGTAPLTWTLQNDFGQLNVAPDGLSATYTLPESVGQEAAGLVVIDVEDHVEGEKTQVNILWLKKTFGLPVEPGFHPGLPATASTQLRVADRDIEPDDIVWNMLAGEGTVGEDTGLFTAPRIIERPYAVVQATVGSGPLAHRGYSIIHLSNFARKPGWVELKSFKLTSDSISTTLYSNGLQQVNVNVTVTAKDVGENQPGEISNEEIGSIELLSKDEKNNWTPMRRVGLAGIPEGGEWGYSILKNDFDQYPAEPGSTLSEVELRQAPRSVPFFVQSRLSGTLEIAASMRGDSGLLYLSTAVGDPSEGERTITLRAKEPEGLDKLVYKFTVERVGGTDDGDDNEDGENDGNDKDLKTIDYFVLQLSVDGRQVKFKTVEFEGAKSIVQWESRQFNEDICSFTGYAFEGSKVLNFDPLLFARIPESVRPEKEVVSGRECPPGCLLISLHRCEYWNFDINCEPDYTSGLNLKIYDVNGNVHKVKVNFKSPTNRNLLVLEKY